MQVDHMGKFSRLALSAGVCAASVFVTSTISAPPASAAFVYTDVSTPLEAFGGAHILPNGNVIVRDQFYDLGATQDVGYIAMISGATLTPIWTMTGTTANDRIGSGALITLNNGNVLIPSPRWDNGAEVDAGAITFINQDGSGTFGTLSPSNSLVGAKTSDNFASPGVIRLADGDYVIISSGMDGAVATDIGAVTYGSGTAGVSGVQSAANSLVGSQTGDQVGSGTITELTNGNFVVSSPNWDSGGVVDVGAATWVSGTTGLVGQVSAVNSLVGSTDSDRVTEPKVVALTNGNYVVTSARWANGAVLDAGAATWGNGTTGVVGAVSTSNSLHGTAAQDRVGGGEAIALTNGHYVVRSLSGAGAATWGNGTTGITGPVNASNSIVGTHPADNVGYAQALTNGHYVIRSPEWDNGALQQAGAVVWGNGEPHPVTGASQTVGPVSASNALIGGQAFARVGYHLIVPLTNGNYVTHAELWGGTRGAVTWGNGFPDPVTGQTQTFGVVSAANSMIGSTAGDRANASVIALPNGNYLSVQPQWDNPAIPAADAGLVSWFDGTVPTGGTTSAANGLVGTTANDRVGNNVTVLTNGNYVVRSDAWDRTSPSLLADVGAVTWASGTSGAVGPLSATTSLIGSATSDQVGSGTIYRLTNGNYVVRSGSWNGARGAVTWGSGTAGATGVVGATNSLVGSAASDVIGNNGIRALANGNYVVHSPVWDRGAISDAGAVTWGNGTTGVTGPVSDTNSLVGTSTGDQVGNFCCNLFPNGDYAVVAGSYSTGALNDAGAVYWADGSAAAVGDLTAANSWVGPTANAGNQLRAGYDPATDRLIISHAPDLTVTWVSRGTPALGAPTGVSGVGGTNSVTVSWTAPTADGGSPITGYTVTASPGGATCTTTGATSCVVNGLDHRVSYTFTVTATTALTATGPVSAPSAAVSPINNAPTISAIANTSTPYNTATPAAAFTIGDVDDAIGTLSVSASSSNTAVIAAAGITLGGSGANRTISVAPVSGASGTATITVTVTDGLLQTTEEFDVTVTATRGSIVVNATSASVAEADGTITIEATRSGGTDGAASVSIASVAGTATSGDDFGATSASSLSWADGESGTKSVTVSIVADADHENDETFTVELSNAVGAALGTNDTTTVTINNSNSAPTISTTADLSDPFNNTSVTVPFTIGDTLQDVDDLILTVDSSNTAIVDVTGLTLTGSGDTWSLDVTPVVGGSGNTTITITVSDGVLTSELTFVVTSTPNGAPTISAVSDTTTPYNTPTASIPFTIGDPDNPVSSLIVTASSSDTSVIPASGITLGGSGANRTVALTPVTDSSGTSTITLSVNDGTVITTTVFDVTVLFTPGTISVDLPTISTTEQDGSVTITVTRTGGSDGPASVTIDLVDGTALDGADYSTPTTITVTWLDGESGDRTFVVPVILDADHETDETFTVNLTTPTGATLSGDDSTVVTIVNSNDPPTVNSTMDLTTPMTTPTVIVPITVGDREQPVGDLVVTVDSSDTSIVPITGIVVTGTGTDRVITVTPTDGTNGSSTITVTVSDGVLTTVVTFNVVTSTVTITPDTTPDTTVTSTADPVVDTTVTVRSLAAPTLMMANADSLTVSRQPMFAGTGEPLADLQVFVAEMDRTAMNTPDGARVCTTQVRADGTWSCESETRFPIGSYRARAMQMMAGQTMMSNHADFGFVAPVGGELPRTGGDLWGPISLAALLASIGAVMLLTARQRNQAGIR
jgi:hypothetical protein